MPYLMWVLIMNECLILSSAFSVPIEIIMQFLSFLLLIWHTTLIDLQFLKCLLEEILLLYLIHLFAIMCRTFCMFGGGWSSLFYFPEKYLMFVKLPLRKPQGFPPLDISLPISFSPLGIIPLDITSMWNTQHAPCQKWIQTIIAWVWALYLILYLLRTLNSKLYLNYRLDYFGSNSA